MPASHARNRRPSPVHRAAGFTQSGAALPWVLAGLLIAGGGFYWWRHAQSAGEAGADAAASAPGPASGASGAGRSGGGGRRFGGGSGVQPVSVEAVRRQDIRISLSAIGSLLASNTAVVHAQVGGVLQSLSFREGQQVQRGQQLAQIDPRAFQASLGQATGALARDKAGLENARLDLQRYRDLFAKDAVAKQQLDTQQALVRQLEGTVAVDQAAVDSAQLQLSYTRVTAPISGRVGLKQADLGNVVQPGDVNGIVSIAQTRPMALVFSVPSANVPVINARLRAKQAIGVEAWDRGGKKRLATGHVETVDNAIDAATDTIKVKALFDNQDDSLFPNQAVSVVLQLDTLEGVLAVPQAAVLRGSQGFYIYIAAPDNTVSTRVVKPGPVDGGWMAVEGTLETGERVVIDGVDRLREGAKVEVIAADPSRRAGAAAPAGGKRGPRPAPGASGASAAAGAGWGGGRAASGAAGAASGSARAPANPAATAEAPPAAASDSGADRRAMFERLPPEVRDKLKAMSPDERRAWFREHRDELRPAP